MVVIRGIERGVMLGRVVVRFLWFGGVGIWRFRDLVVVGFLGFGGFVVFV